MAVNVVEMCLGVNEFELYVYVHVCNRFDLYVYVLACK